MLSPVPSERERVDVLIVGAGIAGLACARALADAGRGPVVLERARGVGGRCATRRVGSGQPVDHGVCFFHGRDRELVAALGALPEADRVHGWPYRVSGRGTPCSPRAYAEGEARVALRPGVSAFPKALARGLDVRLRHRVDGLAVTTEGFVVHGVRGVDSGDSPDADEASDAAFALEAPEVVLAMAPQQSARLLATLDPADSAAAPGLRAARRLCEMLHAFPCATLILGYDGALGATLGWDMRYPETGHAIQLVSHDSSKREDPAQTVLVVQARPSWSSRFLQLEPERWSAALLEEARAAVPELSAPPLWQQTHRWSFARVDPGSALALPMRIGGPRGGFLSLAGDAFSPETGVEGAWLAGRRLARELIHPSRWSRAP
jgi:renalase